ncbi:MAG: DUF1345 domain-containing protein [Gammaproteobacteria bacterium]|nr:DUF1345 domain-containing protein [Gammaproteobacteria bacterium]
MRAARAFGARRRLAASVLAGTAVFMTVASQHLTDIRLLLGWDAACLTFLILAGIVMVFADAQETCRSTVDQDQSGFALLSMALLAACASVFAILFLLSYMKGASASEKVFYLALAVSAITGSWLVVHTLFAFHYAHSYYRGRAVPDGVRDDGGLHFPGSALPHYMDFLYFSFVIGMTSQVSDVAITSHSVRRAALLHGVLSFAFNTLILALTINIVAGLM